MANKHLAKAEEIPETHAIYERAEEIQITRRRGEPSVGKRRTPMPNATRGIRPAKKRPLK